MRKDRHYFINNEGSTMIIIIVCIAFLTIISSLLLTITLNNIQMKSINQKSKANFYEAETALSEIRAGIEEVTADSLEIAYNVAMENYLNETIDKESLFSKTFINEIAKKLGDGIDLTTYEPATIRGYIKEPNAMLTTNVAMGENKIVIDEENPSKPGYIIIKNIKLSYINSENYKTTLSTDIKIMVPDMAFHASNSGTNVFADYGLIADHSISLNTVNNVKVYGNVYAGHGGIILENASFLTMGQGSNIITRGNIDVKNRSNLQILDNPNIWAKNITTSQNINTGTEMPTIIQISGKCYVENDLTLGAKKSDVTLSGEYYGYGNEHIPDKSSAVIINGLKSTLNLSNLNRLLIAGRAYLNPSTGGNEYNENLQGDIWTGESLAIKGNQYAYLVPSECLWQDIDSNSAEPKNIGNPVSNEKYIRRKNKTDGLGDAPMVSLAPEIACYANGYTTVFYNHGSRKEVFFFLTFANEEKVNEFLKYYYRQQQLDDKSKMETRIKSFASSISINTESSWIMSPGHLLTYQEESGAKLVEGTVTPDGSTIQSIADQLKERYKILSQELSEPHLRAVYDPASVFRSIIDISKILPFTDQVYTIDSNHKAYVVDGDFITTSGMQGIVVATGNVVVNGSFTGLILAGGDVSLSAGSTVTASKQVVNTIINKNTELNTIFRNLVVNHEDGSNLGENSRIIVSELIGYENWKLNEE
ncbi:hypothetical protein KQI61_18820 [Anaerocolumna aminovalerica]|uniref:hypothetical protein n=1 Tax=Anaerocolumna aminovalerica TaxID=1527 RepID=UPI001C0EABE3|nr:hypothetical protein [Anaerocolumna aminovalerica]MBU5334237.1 hypothetical protein [Anaerocolumna aminovalerica]